MLRCNELKSEKSPRITHQIQVLVRERLGQRRPDGRRDHLREAAICVRTRLAHVLIPLAVVAVLLLASCNNSAAAEEHFEKGNEYTEAQEYEKAITEFEAALSKDPEHVSSRVNLGVVYYQVGRLEEAIEQYEAAIELQPKDADIHSNLAAAFVQQGKLDQALESYQTAIELNPDLAEAHFGLGVVHIQAGRIEEAVQAIERFQELDTGSDPTATELAKQYLQQLKGP
jgi:tetratricopeptide (TPR) repeat protein